MRRLIDDFGGFLIHELRTTERDAVKVVNKAASLYDKVAAFEMAFERAGVKHYDSRTKYAQAALAAFCNARDGL